jgi:rod shape-determining protein MreB
MQSELGIDLGSSSIVVSRPGEGIVLGEATIAAVNGEDGTLVALGADAERLLTQSRTNSVKMLRPLRESIITRDYTQKLIKRCIRNSALDTEGVRVLVSIPCNFSEVEESALYELCVQAGASEAYLAYAPLASIVGSGASLGTPSLSVNIGASHTDILLICRGRIFYKSTLGVAGNEFDRAIASYISEKHNVRISMRTAEAIKTGIGTVWMGSDRKFLDIKGKDNLGNIRTVRISSDEMFVALEEPTSAILEAICKAIVKVPSDCVGEVFSRGILLCGGGSTLDGLDKMISGVTGVKATLLKNPKGVTAIGLSKMLENLPKKIATGTFNISREYIKNATVGGR